MRESRIIIDPYEFVEIIELEIDKKVNDHVSAIIKGYIADEHEDRYVEMAGCGGAVTIVALDENQEYEILFTGIVKSVSIRTENRLKLLELEAVSATYIMDIYEETNTYQNKNKMYSEILREKKSKYQEGDVIVSTQMKDSKINDMLVQYKETDWQFIKRLASHFNSYIVPEYKVAGVKYRFGKCDLGQSREIKSISYSIKKDIGEYRYKTRNKVEGINENDSIYYVVKSREIYDLCSQINFNDKKLYVYEIKSRFENGEINHYYSLKTENGFKTRKRYNEKLIGVSIDGVVTAVKGDVVKVHMNVDKSHNVKISKWFRYSTVYSSPDGSGWYCMPETGDRVRIYFPDDNEKNAFAISSIHLKNHECSNRSDSNVKMISTKYGKQIKFLPNAIEIRNSDELYIRLFDDGGIEIKSDKEIMISAKENVEIKSDEKLVMTAKEGFELKQSETLMTIDEDIVFSGGQVKMK